MNSTRLQWTTLDEQYHFNGLYDQHTLNFTSGVSALIRVRRGAR